MKKSKGCLVFIHFIFLWLAPAALACSDLLDPRLNISIQESELNSRHINLIKSHSRGVIHYDDLNQLSIKKGYVLGIYGKHEEYSQVVSQLKLTSWEEAYKVFGIGFGEFRHTEKFMETLTRQELPIIFLIPSRLWSHPEGVVTKREVWWLLENPEKMSNVIFVFGSD